MLFLHLKTFHFHKTFLQVTILKSLNNHNKVKHVPLAATPLLPPQWAFHNAVVSTAIVMLPHHYYSAIASPPLCHKVTNTMSLCCHIDLGMSNIDLEQLN